MAEIRLCALKRDRGPEVPADIGAQIRTHKWEYGGIVKELVLYIVGSEVIIWPAVPEKIDKLSDRLKELAEQLRRENQ